MNLSKDALSNDGNECILYGELFTTYGSVIKDITSKTEVQSTKISLSQKNDLLFPSSTTVDALSLIAPSAICKNNVILGGDMFGIHIYEMYSNEYLSYLINYVYKSQLARYAQGSTIIHLHYSDIKNCKLSLPLYADQCHFAKFMRLIEDKRGYDKDLLLKLEHQKAYLLSHLFI
jgi:type I restriction enzyme S subunit